MRFGFRYKLVPPNATPHAADHLPYKAIPMSAVLGIFLKNGRHSFCARRTQRKSLFLETKNEKRQAADVHFPWIDNLLAH